jgi:hypothetical protein
MAEKSDVHIGKFDIMATYIYAKAVLDGAPEAEAKERGMVAAIMGAKAKGTPDRQNSVSRRRPGTAAFALTCSAHRSTAAAGPVNHRLALRDWRELQAARRQAQGLV